MSTVIPSRDVRETGTPNAAMTTLASPTLGGTTDLAMWRVRMVEGQAGPRHTFDTEQVWLIVEGEGTVDAAAGTQVLHAGDRIVLPPGEDRRITAGAGGLRALVAGRAGARASTDGEDRGTPPWIA